MGQRNRKRTCTSCFSIVVELSRIFSRVGDEYKRQIRAFRGPGFLPDEFLKTQAVARKNTVDISSAPLYFTRTHLNSSNVTVVYFYIVIQKVPRLFFNTLTPARNLSIGRFDTFLMSSKSAMSSTASNINLQMNYPLKKAWTGIGEYGDCFTRKFLYFVTIV